jgi:aminoglycoside 3-N-acetyltransferase
LYTREDIVEHLRNLGVAAGDVLMVHASLRAIGEIAGGPDQIHLALRDVLTPEGTLVMYAGCPRYFDEVGRGGLTREEEAEILEKLPPFDPRTARANRTNGALVELFRTWPGSRVNPHVARFVVWGRETDRLLLPQPWSYAFGHGSLLERFLELGGRILLLGSDHVNVTFLHHVEHVVDIPAKRVVRFQVPVLEDGRRVWRTTEEFDTSGAGAHPSWPVNFFENIVDGFLNDSGNYGGRVGNAESYLISSRGLYDYAAGMMKRVAAGEKALQ